MMGNKWIQAVLLCGTGFGLWLGSFLSALFGPIPLFIGGFVLMMLGMWKTADCRGTDGWGGPWSGPKK